MFDIDSLKKDFSNSSNPDLINYIFKRHHIFLKNELNKMLDEVYILYKTYYDKDGRFLEKIYILLSNLKTNYEVHMVKEEKSLFKNILKYDKSKELDLIKIILEDIKSIESNNNKVEYYISELKLETNNYTKGLNEHTGYYNMYKKFKELEIETKAHFELERDILYKRMILENE